MTEYLENGKAKGEIVLGLVRARLREVVKIFGFQPKKEVLERALDTIAKRAGKDNMIIVNVDEETGKLALTSEKK